MFIAQFIKKRKCSEHAALDAFGGIITIRQFGNGLIMERKPSAADVRAAQKGIECAREAVLSGEYDIVILDEANVAAHHGLVLVQDLLDLIEGKPKGVELVITGRYADDLILNAADLVTEMRDVRHYARRGVKARRGIEK